MQSVVFLLKLIMQYKSGTQVTMIAANTDGLIKNKLFLLEEFIVEIKIII
ncbi:hypothetical protein BH10BAC2_BH10BAC2_17540 [soil metagenome]